MNVIRHGACFAFATALLGCGAPPADTFAYYREIMGPGFVHVYFEMAADQIERRLFEIAPNLRRSVWIGCGDQDHGANMGAGVAKLAKLLPRCELRVFPGALASAIDAFLTRPANGPTGQDEPTPGR